MILRRLVPFAILLVSLGALAVALTSQIMFNKEPCILCLYQRVPFVAAGLLALFMLRLKRSSSLIPFLTIISGLVFLAGAGIAVYHVGVEQHWWISGCTGSLADTVSLSDLRAGLMSKPGKACDEIDWTLYGISMATYNVFVSGGLGILVVATGIQLSKTPKQAQPDD